MKDGCRKVSFMMKTFSLIDSYLFYHLYLFNNVSFEDEQSKLLVEINIIQWFANSFPFRVVMQI